MPFTWLLKAHPFDLPGFVRELCFGMRGVGPMVEPHFNWWRAGRIVLLKREHDRAMWRIAQFVEDRPAIKGVACTSWLFSVETGEKSPHLSWVREFFAAENAQIVDAGPALVERGFLMGNERRRRLYESGLLSPRETIVLWSRADMLAWARRHPELADGAAKRAASPDAQIGWRSACSDTGPPLAEQKVEALDGRAGCIIGHGAISRGSWCCRRYSARALPERSGQPQRCRWRLSC